MTLHMNQTQKIIIQGGKPYPIKFLLGEFVLGTWRPKLAGVCVSPDAQETWLPSSVQLSSLVPEGVDGLLYRGAIATSLPAGVFSDSGLVRYMTHVDVLYSVAIQGSFQDYLKKFSAKSRQNLTRSVRRFSERQDGKTGCDVYAQPEHMAVFYAEALAISRQTYQTRLLGTGLPESVAFQEQMIGLAHRGLARGYILRDGTRAIAFAWCCGQGDKLTYSVIGYLPTEAQLSPGTILLYHLLEDLFDMKKFSTIDFGTGEAPYKTLFSTDKQEVVTIHYLRPTFKNQALTRLHWINFRFSACVGQWMERAGVKAKIKKMLRRLHS